MGMSEWYGHADWDDSTATIHRAIDLGVTFIDTADVYGSGHNEVLVGRAIHDRRENVQLATKFGIDRRSGDGARRMRGDAAYVRTACDAPLLRLGVDVIDLYYLHRPMTSQCWIRWATRWSAPATEAHRRLPHHHKGRGPPRHTAVPVTAPSRGLARL
jgi:aryl-alcohol dehydrogenase-like predicted oxidoreductase